MADTPPPDTAAEIRGCATSQRSLAEFLVGLDPVDAGMPSRLPGWTVGHVLTHLARNADGHREMFAGRPMYEGGMDGRAAGIEAGADRPWGELVEDVVSAGAALEVVWGEVADWDLVATWPERPFAKLPFLRWREVEIHRADLGLGYQFTDMPAEYVRRELRAMEMQWKARQPMGMTTLPPEALALDPSTRLAWLTGRMEIDGLPAAGVF